jgi:predicted HTH transcriptional regulator
VGPKLLTKQGIPTEPELWKPENFHRFLEYRRAELADAVNTFLDEISHAKDEETVDLSSLLEADESASVEFKETARVNIHTGKVDKEIEHSVLKSVAAFMNAHGGLLVIGVNDATRELPGLERDLGTLGRQDLDGYEQFLRQLFNKAFGPENSSRINASFPVKDEKQVCVVRAPRSPRPMYLRDGDTRDLYIRDGNTTRRLNSEEAVRYAADHFGGHLAN